MNLANEDNLMGGHNDYDREVSELIDELQGTENESWVETLDRLHRLGIWSRGSIEPRGSLFEAAPLSLPVPSRENKIKQLTNLLDASVNVQRNALLALGEWGGDESVDSVNNLLRKLLSRQDKEAVTTCLYCISALRSIGGTKATASLIEALKEGNPAVRKEALSAISDLLTGGSPSDIDAGMDVHIPQPDSPLIGELRQALIDQDNNSAGLPVQYRSKEILNQLTKIGDADAAQRAGWESISMEIAAQQATGTPGWYFRRKLGDPEVEVHLWLEDQVLKVRVHTDKERLIGSRLKIRLRLKESTIIETPEMTLEDTGEFGILQETSLHGIDLANLSEIQVKWERHAD